jgi:hypothetical protein
MATHAQSWMAGINAPSTLDGCVCGWKVERASILEASKQFEQHMADMLQGASGSPAPEVFHVSELFDNSDTLDMEDTVAGADAERAVADRAAIADAAQRLAASPRELTPQESAAVDAAYMMARASESALDILRSTAARIATGGDRYKLALLGQLLEAQFIAGAAFGAQRACEFAVSSLQPSNPTTSAGDKP